nr:hypothetical protein Itr_chr09CG01880 [Ipomoea trifida]
MVPSTRPPAMRPRENSSELGRGFPQDKRLNRSELATEPAKMSSRSSDVKSSSKMSRLAVELNDRSTAPAMVPAARYGASGANAADADLFTAFTIAMAN